MREVNTTGGLNILTSKQIEMVRENKPRFHVFSCTGMADMDLFCYDPNMTFEEFVDTITCFEEYAGHFEVKLGPVSGNYQVPEKNRDCMELKKSVANTRRDRNGYFWKYHCVEFISQYD